MTFKELTSILKRNFFQPVIVSIYFLAAVLLVLGEVQDAYFCSFVITFNFLIAVVQEIRARRALKKLELMSAPMAVRVTENGQTEQVLYDQLHEDDEIILTNGDEIAADATVISSKGLEVDESMLTGESTPIEKAAGDELLAGSAVLAGSARAKVVAVGENSKAGMMTSKLKEYSADVTPLQKRIGLAITILTYSALGLAILVYVVYSFYGFDLVRIFKTITSGVVVVIPEGLLLASTLLLAYGSLRLAQAKVLPQKLSAIEAMALLQVLCTDKTGTLTEPEIVFDEFRVFDIKNDSQYYKELVGILVQETSGSNATGEAIMAAFKAPEKYKTKDILAFSSERKMSGVIASFGKYSPQSIVMGAPEYVSKITKLTDKQKTMIADETKKGKRVLLLAVSDNSRELKNQLKKPEGFKALGLIILRNDLREGVVETVDFLQKNDVSIRVISGDNPETVKYIAKTAGINKPDRVITGAELAKLDDKNWYKAVYVNTIFARVLPEQKERLIKTFQAQHKFTGMVGDGVNDSLALKQADLGVAMFSGAAASRRVADIVLLNNSFNSLPIGMRLGNRIMQSIELISTLFFHKIIYGVFVLLATMVLSISYPFEPRHNTFMNYFLVSMPTVLWTLFPPTPSYRINPREFWRDTLLAVLPISLISGFTVTLSYWYMTTSHIYDQASIATSTVMIATIFGVYLVFLMRPLLRPTYNLAGKISHVVYVLSVMLVAGLIFSFNVTRNFFDFTSPAFLDLIPVSAFVIAAMILQWQIAKNNGRRIAKREVLNSAIK